MTCGEHCPVCAGFCTKPHPAGRGWHHCGSSSCIAWGDDKQPDNGRTTARREGVPVEPPKIMGAPPSRDDRDFPGRYRRNVDPPNSDDAIQRYWPAKGTRQHQVLSHLLRHRNAWVDVTDLTTPTLGGRQGDRRLRELREQGWPIETRIRPDSSTIWQHRLLSDGVVLSLD